MTSRQLLSKLKQDKKYAKYVKTLENDLEILEILKLCGVTRRCELQIYLSNRTDCDIGNGIAEYEAFYKVKEWLERKKL